MATGFSSSLTITATITDVEFRNFCSTFANVLESGGVIKTADTGQINLTTVTFPGVNSTTAGYEIRRFSDAMQATKPVFLKIEYYREAGANRIGFRISIGTGSDGAGALTGVLYNGSAVASTVVAATATASMAVSAGTNRFAVAVHSGSGMAGVVVLERTRDSANAVTNQGLMYEHRNDGYAKVGRFVVFSGTQPAAETTSSSGACLPPVHQTTGVNADGNIAVYPYFFYGIGETSLPASNLAGGFNTDFVTDWATHTVTLMGVSQTMIKLPVSSITTSRGNTPTSAVFIGLMRYE